MSSASTWDAGGWNQFKPGVDEDAHGSRSDASFSVEKFAAFCAESAGSPLSETEMASARRLCRDLQARQADPDAW